VSESSAYELPNGWICTENEEKRAVRLHDGGEIFPELGRIVSPLALVTATPPNRDDLWDCFSSGVIAVRIGLNLSAKPRFSSLSKRRVKPGNVLWCVFSNEIAFRGRQMRSRLLCDDETERLSLFPRRFFSFVFLSFLFFLHKGLAKAYSKS